MSYLVLARKYRPQTFEEVIGQEHVATTLRNAISTDHLAHAYLFAGPRGVGKTTMARILAKTLNCEKGFPHSPCNQCSICLEITESRSMDVYEIDGASNRGIDEIRNLRENVRYSPAKGRYKIYIIDEVHMLTTEAFNALLKTLEEPPRHVLFLLATTEPQKVLPTILSRCQRFDFRRIRIPELIDRIRFISKKENLEIEEEACRLIAMKAEGSMRDGESILDQLSSYTDGKIRAEDVREVLGILDSDLLFSLTDCVLKQDLSSSLSFLETLMGRGIDERDLLPEWIGHLRNLLHILLDVETDKILSMGEMERKRFEAQASLSDVGKILRMIQIASETENQLRRSDHPSVLLETCLVRTARLDSTILLDDLIKGMETLENKENRRENISNVDLPLNPAPPPHSNLPLELEEMWKGLLKSLPKGKKGLSFCLKAGEPLLFDGTTLLITFPKEKVFEKDQVEEIKNKEILEEILKGLTGMSVRISCEFRQKDSNSLVEKAREIFEAEVVS